jgi:hypothetical protein
MIKKYIITVNGHEIALFSQKDQDFICLTDIAKSVDGWAKVEKWMSSRSTIDFLGTWEAMHNPDFLYEKFATIRSESWNNTFTISVKKRVEETNAIGIFSKMGKLGWVYAHRNIAFEFASWLSPQFKLYIIKEFERLKEDELQKQSLWRDIKRLITKANYRIHTDAIKDHLAVSLPTGLQKWLYASEAELLNFAVFGMTSKDRSIQNPKKSETGNMRDDASIEELTVLSNLEVLNAEMIKNDIPQDKRAEILIQRAKEQLQTLQKLDSVKKIKEKQHIQELKKLWNKS